MMLIQIKHRFWWVAVQKQDGQVTQSRSPASVVELNSIAFSSRTRELNVAEHPEMIRHEVEVAGVVENHRAVFCLQAWCQKNIVDTLSFGP